MSSTKDKRLLAAMRATLLELENAVRLAPNDSALLALKTLLLRAIADLEDRTR